MHEGNSHLPSWPLQPTTTWAREYLDQGKFSAYAKKTKQLLRTSSCAHTHTHSHPCIMPMKHAIHLIFPCMAKHCESCESQKRPVHLHIFTSYCIHACILICNFHAACCCIYFVQTMHACRNISYIEFILIWILYDVKLLSA